MAVLWSSCSDVRHCLCRISGIWSTNDWHHEAGIWRAEITTSSATAAVALVTDSTWREWLLPTVVVIVVALC